MTAIQCKYSTPYRYYANPYAQGQTGNAYAEFEMAADADVDLYAVLAEIGFYEVLRLTLTQFGGPDPDTDFVFTFGQAIGVGAIEVPWAPAMTPADLLDSLATTIAANTDFTVVHTAGSLTMRLIQPFPGVDGVVTMQWDSVHEGGDPSPVTYAPVHPSGLTVNGQYAPRAADTPGGVALATWSVTAAGFDPAQLIGLTLVVTRYTATGSNPLVPCTINLLGTDVPNTPNVRNINITGFSAAQVAGSLAAAFAALGFQSSAVVGTAFTVNQVAFGPGGQSDVIASGTAPDTSRLLFQGVAIVDAGEQNRAFDIGFGTNLFVAGASGPYGGNVIPLRFGKNYGMAPIVPREQPTPPEVL